MPGTGTPVRYKTQVFLFADNLGQVPLREEWLEFDYYGGFVGPEVVGRVAAQRTITQRAGTETDYNSFRVGEVRQC